MKISIVTPTFNSAKYIKETIDSIHQQSYTHIEHIVIDGLSSDNTVEIVKSFRQIKVISEKDSGQSEALNKGFKMADGDILAWQNADDTYLPGAFQTVVDYFSQNPEIDIVYGYYQLIDSSSKWICDIYPIEWNKWLFAHGRFVPLQPTVFWRRRVFQRVGLLKENLHYCMDVDFFSKAALEGFLFKRIPQKLGQFRIHTQSKTQNKSNEQRVKQEYKRVLSDNFRYNFLDKCFFELFHYRSKLAKGVKTRWLKK